MKGMFERINYVNANAHVVYNKIARRNIPAKISRTFNYGYIGSDQRAKGFSNLRQFWISQDESRSLIVAGRVEEDNESDIDYLGFIDKDKFYRQIDFLIVPSQWHEPFGRVVIESLSFGIPVITTGMGGIRELIKDGVGFSYDNTDELARILDHTDSLNLDEYLLISKNAQEHARQFMI